MKSIILSLTLYILTGCGSDDPEELFGSAGSLWPGHTDEFNEWLNRDLDCGNMILNLSGSAHEARPPNDPSYVQNTYWSSTGTDGQLLNQGIWFTTKADQFSEASLSLSTASGGIQLYRLTGAGLRNSSSGVSCSIL